MTLITVKDLAVRRRGKSVLQDVALTVAGGELVGLVGANGAGKTTLMRAMQGLLPLEGHSSLAVLSPRERARKIAWMPQSRDVAWPVSVETLVALGRTPHLGPAARASDADRQAVDWAIARLDLEAFRQRPATELSGGEQARALIARALAQETPILMADEPIAGLDPAHQISTMRIFADLAAEGRAVIVSLHDLGLAVRHCTRLVVLDRGRIVADGPPLQVLSPDRLRESFSITAYVAATPQGPVFQPLEVLE